MIKTILRRSVDILSVWMGWLHRHRRVRQPTNRPVKVNLGCGLTVAPGWINIDGSLNALIANWPRFTHSVLYRIAGARQYHSREQYLAIIRSNKFLHHDLRYSIPLPDNCADFVYSSHFLEHMDRITGRRLLSETLRVLRPGGVVRIGVPDLAYAWIMYQRGDKERMLHDYFFIDGATGYSQHRYLYDYDMLAAVLAEIGFDRINRCQYQQGLTPDLELLDNRADYTLFVEAQKPDGQA